MPRETLTSRPPPAPAPRRRRRRRPVREDRLDVAALGPDAGHEEGQPGRDGPDRRAARPAPSRRRPARPSRPGPSAAARRATRAVERLRGRAGRRVRGDDEVLELAGPRVGRPAQDVGEPVGALEERRDAPRRPRYGLTVTASAPRRSNRATAWRAAVEPMSPRFASATTGRSAGMPARIRSRAAIPADPNASKNARFGLIAAAYGPAASTTSVANRSTPGEVAARTRRAAVAGSGSRPEAQDACRSQPDRAASRSR